VRFPQFVRFEVLNLKLLEGLHSAQITSDHFDLLTPRTEIETNMTTSETPIACTLAADDFNTRIASIAALARDALRSDERRDLVLELRYAPDAADRVREMVRREQECCAFLTFDLREESDHVRLTIRAPEDAREAADMLFEQFVGAATTSACCCR
jgi:hypothetical protein